MVSLCPDVKPETSVVSLLQGNVVKSPQRTFFDWSNTPFSFAIFQEIETIFQQPLGLSATAVHIPRSAEKRSGDLFHVVQSNFLFFPLRSSKIGADKSGRCLEAQEDERTSICLAELAADVLELNNEAEGQTGCW